MSVKIKLFANLSEEAEKSEIEVSARDVKEAMIELVNSYPSLEEEIFKNSERKQINDKIILIKDGRNINYLQGLETGLKDGDELSIFPPVGGG